MFYLVTTPFSELEFDIFCSSYGRHASTHINRLSLLRLRDIKSLSNYYHNTSDTNNETLISRLLNEELMTYFYGYNLEERIYFNSSVSMDICSPAFSDRGGEND